MAIYHHSVSLISRKSGRSATASAAYRAGEKIEDTRTGEVHDYSRKRDVLAADIVMPTGITWQPDRSELWNAVEHKCKHENAQVAREFLVALPAELSADQRAELARSYAQHLANTYSIAVDMALHDEHEEIDETTGEVATNGNFHAHLLTTTNTVRNHAKPLGNKARELDPIASKRRLDKDEALKTGQPNAVEQERVVWCDMANAALERAGLDVRIDHRSNEARGLDDEPTVHLGPTASAMERKKPGRSRIGRENQKRRERNLIRELKAQEIEEEESLIWLGEAELDALGDDCEELEIEIEIKEEQAAEAARYDDFKRQFIAERVQEAKQKADKEAAIQAANDRELEQIRAAQEAEAVARRERALQRLQSVVPDMIRRTLKLMQEMGVKPPDSLQRRLVDRGYAKSAGKPGEQPGRPQSLLGRENQKQSDHEDEHQGPGLG